ncbi:MAG: hypothetical protein R6U98_26300, partial [Pirellulaceae bacterium]
MNEKQPCAWGANKAIRALLDTPEGARTPLVERALEVGDGGIGAEEELGGDLQGSLHQRRAGPLRGVQQRPDR